MNFEHTSLSSAQFWAVFLKMFFKIGSGRSVMLYFWEFWVFWNRFLLTLSYFWTWSFLSSKSLDFSSIDLLREVFFFKLRNFSYANPKFSSRGGGGSPFSYTKHGKIPILKFYSKNCSFSVKFKELEWAKKAPDKNRRWIQS